ncbi:MAG: type I restriction-modification system DNA methylase subunit [Halobacteriales archaeon]
MTPERDAALRRVDLGRHLRRAIDDEPERGTVTFGEVRTAADEGRDEPKDVIVPTEDDDPAFVVAGGPDDVDPRKRDPYARPGVRQALEAARERNAPLAGTVGTGRVVIFDATPTDSGALDRRSKAFPADEGEEVADRLLGEIERLRAGENRWDHPEEAFVDRVRAIHDALSARLTASLNEGGGATDPTADPSNPETTRREFADRAVGRLLVEVLAAKTAEAAGAEEKEFDPLSVTPEGIGADLEAGFERVGEAIDANAIFDGEGPIDPRVPLDPIAEPIGEFVAELDDRDLTTFEGDVLGRIYEGIIPPDRRAGMGEYYTPTAVCDLVNRLAVTDAEDAVLDPACGTGSFLLGAHRRIRSLRDDATGGEGGVGGRLAGIEPNRVPASLARINLAVRRQDRDPETVDLRVGDFFDVAVDDFPEVTSGDGFDAVVGNPPYVRQEDIDDKEHVRRHLETHALDAPDLSRRSDLYAYFLTHATAFLQDGGDLGFVTSDRWLDTRYGEDLQRFLLDHYAIRAVITFDRQVFDDALVDSSVLLLRRETDPAARDSHVATFLRVKEELDVEAIAALVEADHDPNRLHSTDEYRLVTRRQAALREERKWNVFFTAPPVYFDVRASPNAVDLSAVADVTYGVKTGANPFFVGRTVEMEADGLEPYVSPLLKASGQVEAIRVTDDVAEEWRILDVHDLVQRALAETVESDGEAPEARVKRWLAENGHDALLEYVRSGEAEGYHERSSLASRDVWFDLGELPRPRILSTMFTWRTHRVYWNAAEAPTSDQFYYVDPKPSVDAEVLAGILNSRIVWLANELLGRRAGGEGMTRLQTKVYETERWPVPDPRELDEDRREAIRTAFRDLQERELAAEAPTMDAAARERDELDRAVIPALGLDRDDETVLEALQRGVRAMVEMRDEGAGERTSVLVDRERRDGTGAETVDLPGVDGGRSNGGGAGGR